MNQTTQQPRRLQTRELHQPLYEALLTSGVHLPDDVRRVLDLSITKETGPAKKVLTRICQNLEIAGEEQMPLCQDTGMVLVFTEIGENLILEGPGLDTVINEAVKEAFKDGCFRNSVVMDPVKDRTNTGNNLPAVIHHDFIPGSALKVRFLLKGFGSENCSQVRMLKPTAGRQAVIDGVVDIISAAGGAPCPPTILGVGIGGTMDQAAKLSKKVLFRELDDIHPDPWYDELEAEILKKINALGIGGGGLGGTITSLGVKIATYPTHIAGMPLAVSVNCWADRKGEVIL